MKRLLWVTGIILGLFSFVQADINPNYKNTIVTNATTTKEVALTFDDGPYGTSTEKILQILKDENVHATFFLIGKNVLKYPDIVKKIIADGNIIGNHTFSHSPLFKIMPSSQFEKDFNKSESIIASTTGLYPRFFRPPYGRISKSMQKILNNNNYSTILWNVDPEDWNIMNSSSKIESVVLKQLKPISIIVLHDGHEFQNYPRNNIISALPKIIADLKKENYTFVTLDKLLNEKAYFDR